MELELFKRCAFQAAASSTVVQVMAQAGVTFDTLEGQETQLRAERCMGTLKDAIERLVTLLSVRNEPTSGAIELEEKYQSLLDAHRRAKDELYALRVSTKHDDSRDLAVALTPDAAFIS